MPPPKSPPPPSPPPQTDPPAVETFTKPILNVSIEDIAYMCVIRVSVRDINRMVYPLAGTYA